MGSSQLSSFARYRPPVNISWKNVRFPHLIQRPRGQSTLNPRLNGNRIIFATRRGSIRVILSKTRFLARVERNFYHWPLY